MPGLKRILPLIIISQFCCISLWFAGNSVLDELIVIYQLPANALGHLTTAVQLGFIIGTLLFAILTISDRFSPSRVFFISAIIASIFNLGMLWEGNTFWSLIGSRFLTGFFLAGIYPVGLKLAADYFKSGLGRSFSLLVGALVLGTALPHVLKGSGLFENWTWVIIATSILAAVGGLLIFLFVPDGPFRNPGNGFQFRALFLIFKNQNLKKAALGYFGHMWELYAFWAFVPLMLKTYQEIHQINIAISFWSFNIIAIGGLGCVLGGQLSQRYEIKRIASLALLLSGLCALFSPFLFYIDLTPIFLCFLLFWGMMVIADSPLFSTMVANNADGHLKGSALTLVNCIGFAITIASIQLLNYMQLYYNPMFIYPVLAIGPALGLIAQIKKKKI